MKTLFVALFFASLALFQSAWADASSEIRHRMEQRLPALLEQKAKGVIGENNLGFVELRGSAAGTDALVSDENRDREQAYAQIARNTGASPDAVGRARARKIADTSRPGTWVQDERGDWKRK